MSLGGCGLLLATPGGEARVGAVAAEEVERSVGLVDDPALETYLAAIGVRLTESPEVRGGVDFRFRIVDMTAPNAFALPGGHVYVSRGLLVLLNDEDELANVLAHEVAHVSARHHLKHSLRQTPFVPVRLAGGIAAVAVDMAAWPLGRLGAPLRPVGSALVALGHAPGSLYLASHSRGQEDEADATGQRLVGAAGWDPMGMPRVMEALERGLELRGREPGARSFLDTHPGPPDRVLRTTEHALDLEWSARLPIAMDRAHFYAALDGLLAGEPARDGVVAGSEFLHADLDLRLAFPEGWTIENGVQNVTASPADDGAGEEVFATATIVGPGDDPEAVAKRVLAKSRLARDGELIVEPLGALPSARIEGRDHSGRTAYHVIARWVAHRGLVFQVLGAAPAASWERYRAALTSVTDGVRPLVPADRRHIVEARLRIAEARRDERLAGLLARHDAVWDVPTLAAANALPEDAVLGAGQPIKIAVWEVYSPAR